MTVAEKAIFDMFCKELQLTGGQNAHLGWNPGKPDVFVFALGELRNGMMAHDHGLADYHFSARAAVWNRKRELVQQTIMDILGIMPRCPQNGAHRVERGRLLGDSNILTLRLVANGVSPVTVEEVEVPISETEAKRIPCHTVSLTFDVIFRARPMLDGEANV